MDAIRQVGPGSHFLGCDHTQANFQTAFYRSSIADNNSYEQWLAEGEKTAPQRANEIARRWLETYEAPVSRSGHRRRPQGLHRHQEGVDGRRLHLKRARFRRG